MKINIFIYMWLTDVPKYHSIHMVAPSPWTYISAVPSVGINIMRKLDLCIGPAHHVNNVHHASQHSSNAEEYQPIGGDMIFTSIMDADNMSIEVNSSLDYPRNTGLHGDACLDHNNDLRTAIKPFLDDHDTTMTTIDCTHCMDEPHIGNKPLSAVVSSLVRNAPLASPDVSTISSSESSEPEVTTQSVRPSTLSLSTSDDLS